MAALDHSCNEVMTLAAKAARGAGLPPAQAAEFGWVAVAHLLAGRPETDLSDAVVAGREGPILKLSLMLRRLLTGASVQPKRSWPDALLQSYLDTLPVAVTTTEDGMILTEKMHEKKPTAPARCSLTNALKTILQDHAQRTFVPETEASRSSGAGAGLTDND